jgi:hypothetical protein
MSYMKQVIEDTASMIHTGNREELEDLLNGLTAEEIVNLLLEGIQLNGIISKDCDCIAHKLAAYAGNDN